MLSLLLFLPLCEFIKGEKSFHTLLFSHFIAARLTKSGLKCLYDLISETFIMPKILTYCDDSRKHANDGTRTPCKCEEEKMMTSVS